MKTLVECLAFVVGLIGGVITLITGAFFLFGGTGLIWWQAILGALLFFCITAFLFWMADIAFSGKMFEEED